VPPSQKGMFEKPGKTKQKHPSATHEHSCVAAKSVMQKGKAQEKYPLFLTAIPEKCKNRPPFAEDFMRSRCICYAERKIPAGNILFFSMSSEKDRK